MKRGIAILVTFMAVSLLSACNSAGILGIEDKNAEATESAAETDEKKEIVKTPTPTEAPKEFKVGETWTVDDQWSVTILGASMTEERNEYSEQNPNVVYVVDYAYTNLGYKDNVKDGLYVTLDQEIIDSTGAQGGFYPAFDITLPEDVPIGATCRAQGWVGVDNPGVFTINMAMMDSGMNERRAAFVIDPDAEHVEMAIPNVTQDDSDALGVGETWTVDGQWSMTITGVSATDERNEFNLRNPAAVYVVDYEYTNLGYQEEPTDDSEAAADNGLLIVVDNLVVDSAGMMGYSYPTTIGTVPETIPIGETCHAQECIGVDNPGDFRLTVSVYDSEGNKQMQKFLLKVG